MGQSWIEAEQAYNFSLLSENAGGVTLLLYGVDDLAKPLYEYRLDPLVHKLRGLWFCRVPKQAVPGARYYAYSVSGPAPDGPQAVHAFDSRKILIDPYATGVYFPPAFEREAARHPGSNAGRATVGILRDGEPPFDWGDDRPVRHHQETVIYELHVRGFTRSPTSGVSPERRGTFAGVIDKIPYLQELGVTTVELMPVHQFDPQDGNFWGYMPLNFFSPHRQYAADSTRVRDEFRNMVRSLHAAGIEVILDVVYNHTAEGDHRGPTYSFKGIDNAIYYLLSSNPAMPYTNYS
ncbi:MAG: alpha-amylase family glycosyl hydrolase, partial [Deltaproteobacteria bacterium]